MWDMYGPLVGMANSMLENDRRVRRESRIFCWIVLHMGCYSWQLVRGGRILEKWNKWLVTVHFGRYTEIEWSKPTWERICLSKSLLLSLFLSAFCLLLCYLDMTDCTARPHMNSSHSFSIISLFHHFLSNFCFFYI